MRLRTFIPALLFGAALLAVPAEAAKNRNRAAKRTAVRRAKARRAKAKKARRKAARRVRRQKRPVAV